MKMPRPISSILADTSNYLFDGPTTEAFLTMSRSEAEAHAEWLNDEGQNYAVVRFNTISGEIEDVTSDFWREHIDRDDYVPNRTALMRKAGAFR